MNSEMQVGRWHNSFDYLARHQQKGVCANKGNCTTGGTTEWPINGTKQGPTAAKPPSQNA